MKKQRKCLNRNSCQALISLVIIQLTMHIHHGHQKVVTTYIPKQAGLHFQSLLCELTACYLSESNAYD